MSPDLKIKEVQQQLLYLLEEFHQICVDNNIMYSLHGGTLLGAIREKGFIPWDDDVDVSLTREEYEKLRKVLKENKISQEIKFDDFSDRVPRILMNRKEGGVFWIDIFIYDYISENKISQKMKLTLLTLLAAFSKSRKQIKVVKAAGNCTGFKYWCYNAISLVGACVPLSTRIKWMHNFSKNCFTGRKKFIHRGLDQNCAIGLILSKDVMKDYILTPFENTMFMVSSKYHDILLSSYGSDYMIAKRYEKKKDTHDAARDAL